MDEEKFENDEIEVTEDTTESSGGGNTLLGVILGGLLTAGGLGIHKLWKKHKENKSERGYIKVDGDDDEESE